MARKYVEAAIIAVYDYLTANLNAKLLEIRTEQSSDFPANVAQINKRVTTKKIYPRITIYKDFTDHDYAFEEQPLLRPWLEHELIINCEHMSGSLAELDLTLMRYAEAINRLQEDDDTFGDAFVWVRIGREDWSPVYTNQSEKKSVQGVMIPVTCRTI